MEVVVPVYREIVTSVFRLLFSLYGCIAIVIQQITTKVSSFVLCGKTEGGGILTQNRRVIEISPCDKHPIMVIMYCRDQWQDGQCNVYLLYDTDSMASRSLTILV